MNDAENTLGRIEQVVKDYRDQPVPNGMSDQILKLRYSPDEESRISALLKKNSGGVISQVERDELEHFIEQGTILSIIQSKIRLALKQNKVSA